MGKREREEEYATLCVHVMPAARKLCNCHLTTHITVKLEIFKYGPSPNFLRFKYLLLSRLSIYVRFTPPIFNHYYNV